MDGARTQSSYLAMTDPDTHAPPTRTQAPTRLQRFVPLAGRDYAAGRSPLPVSDKVRRFTQGAMADARASWADRMGQAGPTTDEPAIIADWAGDLGLEQLITAHAPIGPAASALDRLEALLARQDIALVRRIRPHDQSAWPHATAGFFRFKDHIPDLVRDL